MITHRFAASSLLAAVGDAERILLTGCGGGCDVFSTVPLYLRLRAEGRDVHLASYAFTLLDDLNAVAAPGGWWRVEPDPPNPITDLDPYQPERHLTRWLARHGFDGTVVWTLERTGVTPAIVAWRWLADHLALDAIVAVDGGTDSLMCGIEAGLGTPVEDVTTMIALNATPVATKLLCTVGFGVDAFHGVSHVDVLASIAALDQAGAFWGVDHLSHTTREGAAYLDLVNDANAHMPGCESIVASSVAAAVRGDFGNVDLGPRTATSELFINPLMAMYWTFDLNAVVDRLTYRDEIATTTTHRETIARVTDYRRTITPRQRRSLPM